MDSVGVTSQITSMTESGTVEISGYVANGDNFIARLYSALLSLKESNSSIKVTKLDISGVVGITALKNYAFWTNGTSNFVTNLESIILPDNVTSIGSSAFRGSGLKTIYIPANLTSINPDAFYACTALSTITASEECKNFKVVDNVLYSKDGTKLVMYVDKTTESAFTVPASVTEIGTYAFCQAKITALSFESDSTLKTIGYNAFYGCSKLTSVSIPSGVTTIGEEAFDECSLLASVTIPDTVTEIGVNAFHNCPSLTKVKIPKTVTEIGKSAFGYVGTGGGTVEDFTIECYTNSAADKYATANGFNISYIDNLGHTHSYKKTSSVAATCGADGYDVYTCSCGASYNETTTSKTNNHTFGDWTTTSVSATQYIMQRTCTVCGKAESKSVSRTNISNATVSGVKTSYQYTGSAITIDNDITVTLDGKTIVKGTDYTIGSYKNNTAAGNNTASCVITGQGAYSGTKTVYFTISSSGSGESSEIVDISGATITYTDTQSSSYSTEYTGKAIEPKFAIKLGSITLTVGRYITVAYSNNVNPGTATITATGTGKVINGKTYTGTAKFTFTITQAGSSQTTTDLSGAAVALSPSSATYTGSAITPTPTVKVGSATLTPGTDYTVSYSNNTNAGTAKVTITGKGNYTGTASQTFTISAASISSEEVTLSKTSYTYTGSANNPTATVKVNGKTLTPNTDYTIGYSNNTNAGTATVTITGKGNYTGTVSKTFTISAVSIGSATVSLPKTSYTYTGSAIKPTPTVKVGSTTLTPGTDYTVSYKDNTNVGTATVTITGKGNYKDSALKTFTITANSGRVPGDANGDGKVNINDVLLIQQLIAEWKVDVIEANCDVNADQKVNINDVLLIQQKIAEWDVELI